MKIPTKQEYFKMIRSNPEYLSLLKKIPEADERRKAIHTVEYIAGSIFDALLMISADASKNPEVSEKISAAMKTGDGIIKENDGSPIVQDKKK